MAAGLVAIALTALSTDLQIADPNVLTGFWRYKPSVCGPKKQNHRSRFGLDRTGIGGRWCVGLPDALALFHFNQ